MDLGEAPDLVRAVQDLARGLWEIGQELERGWAEDLRTVKPVLDLALPEFGDLGLVLVDVIGHTLELGVEPGGGVEWEPEFGSGLGCMAWFELDLEDRREGLPPHLAPGRDAVGDRTPTTMSLGRP